MRKRTIIVFIMLLVSAVLLAACKSNTSEDKPSEPGIQKEETSMRIRVKVNGNELTATLSDNSSAKALYELLGQGGITVNAHDYGNFEKVGALPQSLPRNDQDITTSAGDIILYLGSSICFYYATNSWDFTRLGRVDGAESLNLKEIYGSGDAVFELSVL